MAGMARPVGSFAALLLLLLSCSLLPSALAEKRFYEFVVKETPVKRLCMTQHVITVNDMFPGPTIEVYNGDTLAIKAINHAQYNVTLHWHGLRQMRNGWADGPEFVTQCPIPPGGSYTYRFTIQNQEGTLWWHAHSSWLRATVHGALIIHPKPGVPYPYPKPHSEFPVILAEWWKRDPIAVLRTFMINGQPGDFLPCSSQETSIIPVVAGETSLLRVINAAMNAELFVSLAGHKMTVVAADAMYVKPFETNVILLGPGQTTDVLVNAHAAPGRYYLAARAYASAQGVTFDNTTATAIFQYKNVPGGCSAATLGPKGPAGLSRASSGHHHHHPPGHSKGPAPMLPFLPAYNDTKTATVFSDSIRSPAPVKVPHPVTQEVFTTIGFGLFSCRPGPFCQGPNNTRFGASMNNISFQLPNTISLLQAHYHHLPDVFTLDFPPRPPLVFNFTSTNIPRALWQPERATKLYRVKYGAVVQIVFQDTGIFVAEEHPMHIHGYHFYVLATGFGNYDPRRDEAKFNLVDPPSRNTIGVPVGGWAVVRFVADNPGVWLVHCHIDAHLTGGLAMALVVEDGKTELEATMPPPYDLPVCPHH
ncbi:hypothetical protein QOZ80_3AG0244770 [Eleusine coracana subsp. coracana]|nr:hypothetical protein QOZ80_3AG0244770 [Eleusine coracana subsp. coracana]